MIKVNFKSTDIKSIQKNKKKISKSDRYLRDLKDRQAYMPFTDHFEELRKKLIRSILSIIATAIVSFFFYDIIWQYVMNPLVHLIQQTGEKNSNIKIVTSRLQDDFLIQFKAVFMVGVLAAMPYIVFELWGFIIPALEVSHKKLSYLILVASIILFAVGTLFAHFYIWPLVIKFFLFEWTPPAIAAADGTLIHTQKYLSIPEYLSFFISFHFAFGICFQLPVVSVLLSFAGIINSSMFFRSWRTAIVIIALVSANLTPPDWVSMIALMLPLVVLFCISAFFVYLIEKGFTFKTKKVR